MAGFYPDDQDPLNPYLGLYGSRRLMGRGRGSPAGYLPIQAREANPFSLTRERVQDELVNDPKLQQTFDANTTAEVGTDPAKRRWYQALTIDRAVQQGKPLADVVNAPDYYPSSTTRATATSGQGVDASLWEGANPANYATGNASYDPIKRRYVGFAGGPQTTSYTGEYGGIEGQAGLPYARAMGYTGPDRTAIGPSGPQGNDTAYAMAGGDTIQPATYPRQEGRKMPTSLMDMFQPTNPAGEPVDLGRMLQSRSNSLIGLGLGLMNQRPGTNTALEGYQHGAGLDAQQARYAQALAHQKTQDARQAAQDAFQRSQAAQAQANFERTFARGDVTDFQKAAKDSGLTPNTPAYGQFAKEFYAPKTEQPTIVWQEDSSGNKVPYRQDPRSGTVTPVPLPGQTATAGNPYSASGKMTADEGKVALFADRAATAHAAITKAENLNAEPGGTIGGLIQQNLPAGAANVLVSGERGKAMDAQRAFINAILRRESGAVIGKDEFVNYSKEYFPQLGDTPDQIAGKRQHRAEVIAGLAREGGKGYRPTYSFDEKGHITLGAPTYAEKGQGAVAPGPTTEPAPAATPPAAAIRALKNNPRLRDEFDAKYGEGAAMRILTGK